MVRDCHTAQHCLVLQTDQARTPLRRKRTTRDESRVIGIGPEDVERAAAMHLRCSVHTLWSRYHRAMGDPRSHLRTLLTRPGSAYLAVQQTSCNIVAVGHLMPDRRNAEAALLAEDARQDSGLGTRLLHHAGRQQSVVAQSPDVCCRAAHDGYVNSLKRHAVEQPAPMSLADGRVFISIGRSWTCPARKPG